MLFYSFNIDILNVRATAIPIKYFVRIFFFGGGGNSNPIKRANIKSNILARLQKKGREGGGSNRCFNLN